MAHSVTAKPTPPLPPAAASLNVNQSQGLKERVVAVYGYTRDTFFFGIQQIRSGISRVWIIARNGSCGVALYTIGVVAWGADIIRPGMEARINLWGARLTAVAIEYRADRAKQAFEGEIRGLEHQKQQLNQALDHQIGGALVAKSGQQLLSLQNERLNGALQVAQKDSIQALEGRAELERERNELALAKRALAAEVERLKIEKGVLSTEKESWKVKYEVILPADERNNSELTEAYRALQAPLSQAHQAYQRRENAPNINIQLAQASDRLKETYEAMLSRRIASLPANDPALIPLRGLLECSQRDREITANVTEEFALQATLFNLADQVNQQRGE
jgi:hypothetical protein